MRQVGCGLENKNIALAIFVVWQVCKRRTVRWRFFAVLDTFWLGVVVGSICGILAFYVKRNYSMVGVCYIILRHDKRDGGVMSDDVMHLQAQTHLQL